MINDIPQLSQDCCVFIYPCSNPGVRTIEEELINALYKVEAITEDAKACLGKVSNWIILEHAVPGCGLQFSQESSTGQN